MGLFEPQQDGGLLKANRLADIPEAPTSEDQPPAAPKKKRAPRVSKKAVKPDAIQPSA